jgi:hypothetical protein
LTAAPAGATVIPMLYCAVDLTIVTIAARTAGGIFPACQAATTAAKSGSWL